MDGSEQIMTPWCMEATTSEASEEFQNFCRTNFAMGVERGAAEGNPFCARFYVAKKAATANERRRGGAGFAHHGNLPTKGGASLLSSIPR